MLFYLYSVCLYLCECVHARTYVQENRKLTSDSAAIQLHYTF